MSPFLLALIIVGVAGAVMGAAVLLRRYELAQVTRFRLEAEARAQSSSRELQDLKYAIDQASIIAITDRAEHDFGSWHVGEHTPADGLHLLCKFPWQDAFRAGGYQPAVSERFIRRIQEKVSEGLALCETAVR